MIAWGRKSDIQSCVANVPDKWLIGFAIARPGDVRKFGESSNSTLLFRASAVLEAVESGEWFRRSEEVKVKSEEVDGSEEVKVKSEEVDVEEDGK